MSSIAAAVPTPADDDTGILLFGASAARRDMLPTVRDEAKRRALGIVPCEDAADALGLVASRKALLLCVIAWPEDDAARLAAFIENLRRRQANPLLEIVVSSAGPFSDMELARLRALRVTVHRRRHTDETDPCFADVLAAAARHALETRALHSVKGMRPLSPMRMRGLVELAGVFGSAMQRRNAGDLLRCLPPLRSGEATAVVRAGKLRRRAARRRRKPASRLR